jgi:hypothetical protein
MLNTIIIIIILGVFFKLFIDRLLFYINSTRVRSSIDNRFYTVRNDKNSQQSADLLAEINRRVLVLINHLDNLKNKTVNTKLLVSRYNPDSLMENVTQEHTTYTVNKGNEISVCLSTRDNNQDLYDINRLMFVIIHELAHIGSESYGHNKEFVLFFMYLLKQAVELKIYNYQDYSKQPIEYCGININTTPL